MILSNNSYQLLIAYHVLGLLALYTVLSHLILTSTLWGQISLSLSFMDGKVEHREVESLSLSLTAVNIKLRLILEPICLTIVPRTQFFQVLHINVGEAEFIPWKSHTECFLEGSPVLLQLTGLGYLACFYWFHCIRLIPHISCPAISFQICDIDERISLLFLQKRLVQDFYFLDSIQGFLQSQQRFLQVCFENKLVGL